MPRVLLEAEVQAPFGSVRVMTTHLEYHSASLRAVQVMTIREIHRLATLRARRPPQRGAGPYADGQGQPTAFSPAISTCGRMIP